MSHVNPQSFRRNFPDLQNTVYLSSCSLGARSKQMDHSMQKMLGAMSDGAGAWHLFEEQVAQARDKFARLIGARSDQIAVMPNASVGAYQIASCIDWSGRPEILTSMAEFPSIAHVWLAQRDRGAKVKYTQAADEDAYVQAMGAATGMVSVPLVSYSDGRKMDVKAIAETARAKGIRVFVDAYQALGVQPVDVNGLECDYLVAGASKYMLGLPGVAFVYERSRGQVDHEPQLTGWFGRENPFSFDPTTLDFASGARRFETGTPAIPALYAANAGLDLLLDLDMDDVRRHISSLVGHVQDRLTSADIETRGPSASLHRGAHVAVFDPHASALEAHLAISKIRISPRGDLARLAFHYYNTKEDADAVCDRISDYMSSRQRDGARAACVPTCQTPVRTVSAEARALAELSRWREAPQIEIFPYDAVVAAYRENGKAFVGKALLGALDALRTALPALEPTPGVWGKLRQFLNVALDKFDGTYEYTSYCALPLWPLPTNPGAALRNGSIGIQRDRQLLALTMDCLRFELDAQHGRTRLMPEMRPDAATYEKRVRAMLNAARYAVDRLGLPVHCGAKDVEAEAQKLCDLVHAMLTAEELQALELTMLPVYVVHDEYMFLRILQCFETNFAWMAVRLQSAIDAFDTGPDQVIALINDANRMFREAAKFFPVLATMQGEAFQVFRAHTEGASAIQSRNYKLVESLCRAPDDTRRDSLAYQSVPEVLARVQKGQDTLDKTLAAARAENRLTAQADAEIGRAMESFAGTLQQWRQIHFRLAVKMLGEATKGTGATEGTAYLSAVRSVPVFKSVEQGDLVC